mgnify:CR=1 FL=1
MSLHHQHSSDGHPITGLEKAPSPRVVTTLELLGNARELIIRHAGEEYHLRVTRQEKLILTK